MTRNQTEQLPKKTKAGECPAWVNRGEYWNNKEGMVSYLQKRCRELEEAGVPLPEALTTVHQEVYNNIDMGLQSYSDALEWLVHYECDHFLQEELQKGRKIGKNYGKRKIRTGRGIVEIKNPQPQQAGFVSVLIGRYQRHATNLLEMLYPVSSDSMSLRDLEERSELLCQTRIPRSTLSRLTKMHFQSEYSDQRRRSWKNKEYSCVQARTTHAYVRGFGMVGIHVLLGIRYENKAPVHEVLHYAIGLRESRQTWSQVLQNVKERGLQQIPLIAIHAHPGLIQAIQEVFPQSDWQPCTTHWLQTMRKKALFRNEDRLSVALWQEIQTRIQEEILAAPDQETACAAAAMIGRSYDAQAPHIVRCLQEEVERVTMHLRHDQECRIEHRCTHIIEHFMEEAKRRTKKVRCHPTLGSLEQTIGLCVIKYNQEPWS